MVVSGDTNCNALNAGLFPSRRTTRGGHRIRYKLARASEVVKVSAEPRGAARPGNAPPPRRRHACAHARVSPPGFASRCVRPGVNSSARARPVATAAPRPAAHRRHTPSLKCSTHVRIRAPVELASRTATRTFAGCSGADYRVRHASGGGRRTDQLVARRQATGCRAACGTIPLHRAVSRWSGASVLVNRDGIPHPSSASGARPRN